MRPKDTAATASKPAGNGVKRRASGSAEGSGSKAPPGKTTQPIPIRGPRLGVREPLSKPYGTNPSRPGSSGGPVPKSLSYSSWDPNNGKRPIDLNSVESHIIADSYHIAWQYINTDKTMKYLKRLGEDCRDDWTDPANEGKYGGYVWQGNMMMDMDVYLYNFLKGLAEETPAIIKRSLRKNDGRHPHAQAHMEGKYSGDLTEIVDTRRLFYIKISDLLVAHLLEAYNQNDDRYQLLRLFTAIVFYHELCHAWVFFLIGFNTKESELVGTPPKNAAPRDRGKDLEIGESGFWMENKMNGGCLVIKPTLEAPGSKDIRSTVYIEGSTGQHTDGRPVPVAVARAFNENPMVYDLKKAFDALW